MSIIVDVDLSFLLLEAINIQLRRYGGRLDRVRLRLAQVRFPRLVAAAHWALDEPVVFITLDAPQSNRVEFEMVNCRFPRTVAALASDKSRIATACANHILRLGHLHGA